MTSPNQRISKKLFEDMKKIINIRIEKKLMNLDEARKGLPEITELLTRTQGYQISLNELKIKPKKKNFNEK